MVVAGARIHLKKRNAINYREKHQLIHATGVSIEFIENCGLEAKAPIHPKTLSPAHLKNRFTQGKLVELGIWLKLKTDTGECIIYPLDG